MMTTTQKMHVMKTSTVAKTAAGKSFGMDVVVILEPRLDSIRSCNCGTN